MSSLASFFASLPAGTGESSITVDQFVEAAGHGVPSAVRAFLAAPATAHLVNELSSEGKSAVEEAARNGDAYVLELLLQSGPPPPAAPHVHQAFHMAVLGGHKEAVQYLLRQERVPVDVGVRNECGQTAMHLAAQRGHAAVLQVLLDQGAPDPYVRQAQGGKTPAELAHEAGAHDCVAVLVAYAPTWRRHVRQLLDWVATDKSTRLERVPGAVYQSHVLVALGGAPGPNEPVMVVAQERPDDEDAMDQSEGEEDDEEFPVVLSQETKPRKLRRCGTDEDAYVFAGLLPSSQDSNDSFSSFSSADGGSGGQHASWCRSSHHGRAQRQWVALQGKPLPSHSFHGEPME